MDRSGNDSPEEAGAARRSTDPDEGYAMRAQIKKYFRPVPAWAIWMSCIGIILLAHNVALGVMIAIPGVWALALWRKRLSDAEVDAWTQKALEAIQKRALLKAGIDPSEQIADPITLGGPDIDNARLISRKGKDNVLRFNPTRVVIINFTQHHFLVYRCVLDLTTGYVVNETSEDYFYQDVVSVSTADTNLTVQLQRRTIRLSTTLIIQLRDQTVQIGSADTLLLEKALQIIRKLLREAKDRHR